MTKSVFFPRGSTGHFAAVGIFLTSSLYDSRSDASYGVFSPKLERANTRRPMRTLPTTPLSGLPDTCVTDFYLSEKKISKKSAQAAKNDFGRGCSGRGM